MSYLIRLAAVAALLASNHALAVGSLAQVSIVDRSSGSQITPHFYRGEYWVAGRPGATYAIEIHNRLGERLLAVTSVDGVNVISGANAGWDQTGYVFAAGEEYQITGWRKSDAEVAAFTFTALPNSYAARTGRPANVGVIGVALFREVQQPPPQVYAPTEPEQKPEPFQNRDAQAGARSERAAPSPLAEDSRRQSSKLGTGHGERESSYVSHTDFERLQEQPNEVIRIRYDSFENLVAMGIIERPRRSFPEVNPFPASAQQQYVPDPPSARTTAPRGRSY